MRGARRPDRPAPPSARPRAGTAPAPPPDLDLAAFDVSRETLAALEAYLDLLARWQRRINLVAASTLTDAWHRHILDSLQIAPHLPTAGGTLVDVGSGAGFPGLVLALVRPMFHVKLIEANAKKAAFLRAAVAETGARNVEVRRARVEEERSLAADVLTARAVAPLPDLLRLTEHVRRPDTICLFLKGADVDAELTAAREAWMMRVERHGSVTRDRSVLLKLSEVRRAP